MSRATTRTVSSRPGSGMMGSAQTEHLGAYCLEGSKAVQVGMWGEAPVLSPERRESRRWCHGNRQTSLPTFPTSQGREEAQQKGLRPATLLSQNPPNPNPLPPGPHPITSILQKARPEEPCWSHPWTPDPSPPPTTQVSLPDCWEVQRDMKPWPLKVES